MITAEDERLYKLKPLPDVEPAFGAEAAQHQADYEESRRRWRLVHPIVPRENCE